MSTVATLFNVNDFIGKFGFIYLTGIVVLHIDPINGIAITLAAVLIVSNVRRAAPVSLGHWLEQRYSGAVGLAYSLIWTLVWMVFNLGLYIYGGALVLNSLLGVDMNVSIIGLSAVAAVYTLMGGFRAVVATDILQLLLLFFPFIVLASMILVDAGGIGPLLEHFNPDDANSDLFSQNTPHGPLTIMIVGALFTSFSYWSTEAQILQRPLSTRSPDDAATAYLGSVAWIVFLKPLLVIIPVLAALPIVPALENPDQIGPYLIIEYLPAGMYGMIIIGLVAGFLSSADSQINAFCTMFTTDIVQRRLYKKGSDLFYLNLSRILGIVFTIAAIGMAYWISSNKSGMMAFAISILVSIMPPFGAITLLAMLSPRMNSKGAIAGLIVGGVVSITLLIMEFSGGLQFYRDRFDADTTLYLRSIINFTITTVTCLIVSYLTPDESHLPNRPEVSFKLSPSVKKQVIVMSAGTATLWAVWIILFG